MSESRDAKLNEALHLIRLFEGTVQKAAAAAWLDIDVPIAQMRVLFALSQPPGSITVGRIGEELHIGMPAASRLVERLIQEGLVTRSDDPADRRRTLVELSPRGEGIMNSVGGVMRSRLRLLLTQLQEDDLDAFLRGLRALKAVITRKATPE